jgi:UDP-GlcNAc:undecaprenyl-phosphate GlcNAc-1-phosphate transferase
MISFLFSFVTACLLAPAVIAYYRSKNWVDDPETHRHAKVIHAVAVPRGGGLVVMVAILLSSVLFVPFTPLLVSVLVSCLILGLVGIWDDVADIHPLFRLGVGVGVAALVVLQGARIDFVTNPFGVGVLDLPTIISTLGAIFFIVWNMNIINWSKGVDGQMPGFVSCAALVIGLLSLRFAGDPQQVGVTQLSWIVSGAFAGLLVFNWYPQKMMPGYGAGSLAGFLLAVLSIMAGTKLATTLMVLAVPTADGIFTIARRLLAGKSPWWGDRGHLHHKLMDVFGWSKPMIAVFYWTTSLFLGVLSLYLNTWGKLFTIGVALTSVFAILVWAKYTEYTRS